MPSRASVRQDSGPRMEATPGSIISSGIRTRSSTRWEVTEALMLALPSTGWAEKPGASVGTRNPRTPSEVLAQITARSATSPLVIQALAPSITQSPATRRGAGAHGTPGSLPASGSVRPKHPITSPLAHPGKPLLLLLLGSVLRWMGNMHSDPCTEMKLRNPESPASNSRAAMPYSTGAMPAQPYPSRCMPNMPHPRHFGNQVVGELSRLPPSSDPLQHPVRRRTRGLSWLPGARSPKATPRYPESRGDRAA